MFSTMPRNVPIAKTDLDVQKTKSKSEKEEKEEEKCTDEPRRSKTKKKESKWFNLDTVSWFNRDIVNWFNRDIVSAVCFGFALCVVVVCIVSNSILIHTIINDSELLKLAGVTLTLLKDIVKFITSPDILKNTGASIILAHDAITFITNVNLDIYDPGKRVGLLFFINIMTLDRELRECGINETNYERLRFNLNTSSDVYELPKTLHDWARFHIDMKECKNVSPVN